jgi:hypothetical protein
MKKRATCSSPIAGHDMQIGTAQAQTAQPLKLESAAGSNAQMPDLASAYIEICTSLIAR